VKLRGRNGTYAAAVWALAGALAACSGDDAMGPAETGGAPPSDSGRESGSDASFDGARADSGGPDRTDGAGGRGGAGGAAGATGVGGAAGNAGTGGSAGAISDGSGPDRDGSDTGADVTDATLDTPTTAEAEAGPRTDGGDGTASSDTGDGATTDGDASTGAIDADARPTTADADAGPVLTIDGSDGPVDPRAACTAVPGNGMLLFPFDGAGEASGWVFNPDAEIGIHMLNPPAATQDPTWNAEDGCPASGQLRFIIPFDSDSGLVQGARFSRDFSLPLPDWTSRSVLHIRFKLEVAAGFEFVQPFIDISGPLGYQSTPDGSVNYRAENLGVNVWRDITVNIPDAPDAGTVSPSRIGFEVYATHPGVVSFVVDTIWVE
jgi:hypothetical protein